ncbi:MULTISPECIES: vitamin K epoxide reductase family protein [Cellulosimicrobium]|uniref:Vitamin K epoxide reductase n=1 Tax=Cellulosimicrobium funkei TaxID=264251 RepID=A0A0H2KKA5_9MICO|nr:MULTISPECIES: vitamin K epoxide reductase family protein [Cellulosimicrobium]KLN33911.1 vitamin K epoxide reductase [Cellulosimicrobium funkei]KZM76550.1 vitamin K epoxide reductase [Cellulosimicrobium sp. I38E]
MSKSATAGASVSADHDDELLESSGPRPISARTMGWLLVVLGAIGLAGSAALAIEKFLKLADPNHVPSCSLNALLDCGDAMDSWQGSLLGFPNPLLGIAAFPVVITTGVVLLAGARLPRWYWLALLGGTTLGMGLIVFLIWTTMYEISAMCPYCMVVWFAMLPLFWYQVVHAVQEGYLPAGDGVRRTLVGNRHLFLAIGYVALVAWILLVKGPIIMTLF